MADASILVDQDQFSCPVCLDLLKDSVAIPCGHSFCMVCINDCWDKEDQRGVYSCPQCRETFTPRPVLRRNNMLAEVVEKLKKTEVRAASSAHCYAGPGDVECDFCTGRKRKASESCLMCVASLCETHLKPHLEIPALKKHKLVKASTRLQEKICSRHDKLMEIYCRTDQTCICYMCLISEHKGHDSVVIVEERAKKQSKLDKEQKKSQQKLQEKEKKLQKIKQDVISFKVVMGENQMILTQLIRSIRKKISEIKVQESTELSAAEELLEQLEQEITDLKRRHTDLEQLSHTEDDIQFLQSFQSVCVSSRGEDSPSVTVHHHLSFDGVMKSLSDLKEQLEKFWSVEFSKIAPRAAVLQMSLPSEPKSREDFLQYFCQMTLDRNTVHHSIKLSENNRVVDSNRQWRQYFKHPERFGYWRQVLSKESVSGRCYWEVEWSSKRRGWVSICVSYKGISRKGKGIECWLGRNNLSWSLDCDPLNSFWHNNTETKISAPPSSRIGVYVDHSAGTLSFYSVSDTMTLLHTVHTTFTQPLYAGFAVGVRSSVKLCEQIMNHR